MAFWYIKVSWDLITNFMRYTYSWIREKPSLLMIVLTFLKHK